MNDREIKDLRSLFVGAIALPVSQRGGWIRAQCGNDIRLIAEIETLLDCDSLQEDPLEQPIDAVFSEANGLLNTHRRVGHNTQHMTSVASRNQDRPVRDDSRTASAFAPGLLERLVEDQRLSEFQASILSANGSILGEKYELIDLLDTGGMGIVFKAIHRPMNRVVALKMIARRMLASHKEIERFQREVRVAATLENVNIVRAYDAYHDDDVEFLVMEYVNGHNLRTLVGSHGPMTVELALDCILQAARGLRYAHTRSVVHRDIKPSNLMLTPDGLLKVLDLGLADFDGRANPTASPTEDLNPTSQGDLQAQASPLTCAGDLLGTISFMSPEQSRDAAEADVRSDIYSLGCTLFYLLAGIPPFTGESISRVMEMHRSDPIPCLRARRKDVSVEVDAMLQKMLAKDPTNRYQSMDEVITATLKCEAAVAVRQSRDSVRNQKPLSIVRNARTRRIARGLEIIAAFLVGAYGAAALESQPMTSQNIIGSSVIPIPRFDFLHQAPSNVRSSVGNDPQPQISLAALPQKPVMRISPTAIPASSDAHGDSTKHPTLAPEVRRTHLLHSHSRRVAWFGRTKAKSKPRLQPSAKIHADKRERH